MVWRCEKVLPGATARQEAVSGSRPRLLAGAGKCQATRSGGRRREQTARPRLCACARQGLVEMAPFLELEAGHLGLWSSGPTTSRRPSGDLWLRLAGQTVRGQLPDQ